MKGWEWRPRILLGQDLGFSGKEKIKTSCASKILLNFARQVFPHSGLAFSGREKLEPLGPLMSFALVCIYGLL